MQVDARRLGGGDEHRPDQGGVERRVGLALDLEHVDRDLLADEQDQAGEQTGAEHELAGELPDRDEGAEREALEFLAAQLEGDLRVGVERQRGVVAGGEHQGLLGLVGEQLAPAAHHAAEARHPRQHGAAGQDRRAAEAGDHQRAAGRLPGAQRPVAAQPQVRQRVPVITQADPPSGGLRGPRRCGLGHGGAQT